MTRRRDFVLMAGPAVAGLIGTARTASAEPARLEEADPIAIALGYKHEASQVDTKKFANYVVGRNCANCLQFQGKGADAWGVCPAVGGRLVAAKGWCAAWGAKS